MSRRGARHEKDHLVTGLHRAWWRAGLGSPWQAVGGVASWRDCFLVLAARLTGGGEGIVLPVGVRPEANPGAAERRVGRRADEAYSRGMR